MIGAIIGDTVGSKYEFNNIKTKDFEITQNDFMVTGDTILTLAVCDILQRHVAYDNDEVVDTFKRWARAYPNVGYGSSFIRWALYSNSRAPYNSCGNGSAMRVSACGWYGRSEEEVKALSKAVTEVTHNHREGLKGAEVTAMCVYYARIGKSKEFIKNYVEQHYKLDFDYEELRKTYYHGDEICQVTVPQAIYCFLISNSFEDCLRTTISIGGDCDTTAAISCAIAEAFYKDIPAFFIKGAISALPKPKNGCNPREVVNSFLNDRFALQVFDEDIDFSTKLICSIKRQDNTATLAWGYSKSFRALAEYVVRVVGERENECYDFESVQDYFAKVTADNAEMSLESLEKLIAIANGLSKNKTLRFVYFDNVNDALEFMSDTSNASKVYEMIFNETYQIQEEN